MILFVLLCVGGFIASNQSLTFVMRELVTRIGRNTFLVLALIIPVLAGMGMNFGIVIGAMAAQIAIFLTTYWGFVGISGFLLTVLLATPMAIFFGFLVGKLPTSSGEYRVNITYRAEGNTAIIQSIRIE